MMDSDESDPDAGLYESSDDEDYVPDGASGDDDDDDYTMNKSRIKPKGKQKGKKQPTKKMAQKPTRRSSRKRSRGICLREPDSDEESEEPLASSGSEEEDEEEDANENYEHQEEQKKRIDDIWTSMKSDKDGKKNLKELENQEILEDNERDAEKKEPSRERVCNKDDSKEEDDNKDIKANTSKKVLNDSKELVTDKISGENEKADPKQEAQSTVAGKRRSGGLGNVVGSLNKKQKLSTLEKSKLDWDSFKKDKGLEDELRNKSKDGYLSKQEFLQRVDYRTWENERELRLATGRAKK